MIDNYKSLEFDVVLKEISERAAFSLGKEKVLSLSPSNNTLMIKRDLALVKEVMDMINLAENYDLGGVSDVNYSLAKSSKDMVLSGLELLKISDLNNSVKSILSKVKNSESEVQNVEELISSLIILDELSKQITKSVNSYGEVLDSASKTLDSLRKELTTLNRNFDLTINNFINRNKSILADSIASERNDRRVILLSNNYKNTTKGVIHGESQSGQSIYFEPEVFIRFNNESQSLTHLIMEEEERILFQLSQMVKSEVLNIENNLHILTTLDKILAIAKWGYEREAIIAEISEDQSIYLEAVAHPLIDRSKVVRNTYAIKDGTTLIVSGPNTGGKTVTLKTIGLSILMSMCGIPVLADKAVVPIVDNIFIDLGDEQSVVSALSTFSSHLVRLSDIVNNVSKNSLVMLDELGSGTDPKEGEALAVATLEYLRKKGAITLVTTHLSGLKTYAQNADDIMLASVEFNPITLSPTYKFIEGLAGASNALEIASKFDFPQSLLDRAFSLKSELLSEDEKAILSIEAKEKELLYKNRELDAEKAELEAKVKAFEEKVLADKLVGSKIIEKAKKEALEYVKIQQEEIDKLYADMLEMHKSTKLNEASKIKEAMNKKADVLAHKKKSDHVFVVGDHVKIDGMQHYGQITELDRKNVSVNVNGMNIKTKLNKLEYIEIKKSAPIKRRVSVVKTSTAKLEINLIGQTIHEAIPNLGKFIDNAIVNNVRMVTVVHGVGSGKLRAAVHDSLRKNKSVKSFKSAPQSSGGLGATLVEL